VASLVNDPNGYRRIQFQAPTGERKSIRLGKLDKKTAEAVSRHVEAILSARTAGQPLRQETAVWIVGLGVKLKGKLVNAGLIEPTATAAESTLGKFLDSYMEKRTDVKPATVIAMQQSVESLKAFFGAGKPLSAIHAGDAEDFKRWLMTSARKQRNVNKVTAGLRPATAARRLRRCSTFFTDAIKRELITKNPFAEVKSPKAANSDRQEYVPAATIERVIDFAPSAEWKLLLAMSRYLGVRVPSEPFSMSWDCVDWERGRLRIPSPKTEVHGKAYRMAPILPPVRERLEQVYDLAPEGAVYIFEELRRRESTKQAEKGFWAGLNLRTNLLRIIKRAGFEPWPRLWHNLRASAQTDLANHFPSHVVCGWLGNSEGIALEHYLQTTDEHFEAAAGKAAQKAAHQPSDINGNARHRAGQVDPHTLQIAGDFRSLRDTVQVISGRGGT
jgi:integrase